MHFYEYPYNMSDSDLNNMSYWYFEELIKMVNSKNTSKMQDLLSIKPPTKI